MTTTQPKQGDETMKIKEILESIIHNLGYGTDLESEGEIVIIRRNADGGTIYKAVVPVMRVTSNGSISIEESDISWEPC